MDPNANLREQLAIAKAILADPDLHSHAAVRLAELAEAMNEWIRRGGFVPAAWGADRHGR